MGFGTTLIAGLLVGTSLVQSGGTPSDSRSRFRYVEMHMGVPFRISVYGSDEAAANKAAAEAFKRIATLNSVFSDYLDDSEVTRLRKHASRDPVPVSKDLALLLRRSLKISGETDGAFDVTVGPLVRLWRRARRRKQLPEKDLLAAAIASSGYKRCVLKDRSLSFKTDGMRLDFGAIAKGFACDEALRVLGENGFRSALIDGGGDIAVGDAPPEKPGWRIQIEPMTPEEPVLTLVLKNQAVATSGDRYRFVEIDGKRYSHIVDPRTGMGLTSRLTVTVIANNATDADAYASAVSVLGLENGLRFASAKPGIECRILDYSRAKPEERHTSGFKRLASPDVTNGPDG